MLNKKLKPYVTEKTSSQMELSSKLTFLISSDVNKIMIKQQFQIGLLASAKEIQVHITKNKEKKVRRGRVVGYTQGKKKAVVTLTEKKVFEEVRKLF